MAYGGRRLTIAKRTRGGAKVVRKRRTNLTIKRVYKTAKPKTLKTKNKSAIMKLARQVRGLQMQDHGSIQRCVQHASLTSGQMPTVDHPVLFCVNNFYADAQLFRGKTHTVSGVSNVGGFDLLGSWAKRDASHVQNLDVQHKWDYRASLDNVSALQYMPLASDLKLYIKLGNYYTQATTKFRITFFTRKTTRMNDFLSINDKLPIYAGAFKNMAHDDLAQRREFSPYLHKILYDKWVVFKPFEDIDRNTQSNEAGSRHDHIATRYLEIPWKFDGKMLKTDLDKKDASSGDYASETFYTNVPVNQQIWCCISSNMTPGADGHPGNWTQISAEMKIMRCLKWRDKHGVATV